MRPCLTIVQSVFLAISFAVALCWMLMFELVRIARLPPLGAVLHTYIGSFADKRDEGVMVLSHIYLLAACAAPVWISSGSGAGNVLEPYSGLVVIGLGDSMVRQHALASGCSDCCVASKQHS